MKARDAAYNGRLEEATALLQRARTLCGPSSSPYFERVEQLIEDRHAEKQRTSEGSGEQQLKLSPVERFSRWVRERRDAVSDGVTALKCAPRGSDAYGFCEAQLPGSPQSHVRYWQADPSAFCFTLSGPEPLTCQDLGAHRIVHQWASAERSYQLCELMDHELRSLSALLEKHDGSFQLDVYSHAYTERDKAFSERLNWKR